MAEEFFRAHDVTYTRYDIAADAEARRHLVEDLQSQSTATVVVDGTVYIGFGAHRRVIEEAVAQRSTPNPEGR